MKSSDVVGDRYADRCGIHDVLPQCERIAPFVIHAHFFEDGDIMNLLFTILGLAFTLKNELSNLLSTRSAHVSAFFFFGRVGIVHGERSSRDRVIKTRVLDCKNPRSLGLDLWILKLYSCPNEFRKQLESHQHFQAKYTEVSSLGSSFALKT